MLQKILQNVNRFWFQSGSPRFINFISISPRVNYIKSIVSGCSQYLTRYSRQFTTLNDCNTQKFHVNTKFEKTNNNEHDLCEKNLISVEELTGLNILHNNKENNVIYTGIFYSTITLQILINKKNCNIINILRNENLGDKNNCKESTLIKFHNIKISENDKELGIKDKVDYKKYQILQSQVGKIKLNHAYPFLIIENRVKYLSALGYIAMMCMPYPNNANESKNSKEENGNNFEKVCHKKPQFYIIITKSIKSHENNIKNGRNTKFSKYNGKFNIPRTNCAYSLNLLQPKKIWFWNPEEITINKLSDFSLLKRSISTLNWLSQSPIITEPSDTYKAKVEVRSQSTIDGVPCEPIIIKKENKGRNEEENKKEEICGRITSKITCCDVCHNWETKVKKGRKPKRGKSSPYFKIGFPSGLRGLCTSIYYMLNRKTKCRVKAKGKRIIHKPRLQKKKIKKIKEDHKGKAGKGRIKRQCSLNIPKLCTCRTAPCLELCVCNARTQTPLERIREELNCKPPPRQTMEARKKVKHDTLDLGIKCRRRFYHPKLSCRRNKKVVLRRGKRVQYLSIGKCSAWKRFKNSRERKYRDLL